MQTDLITKVYFNEHLTHSCVGMPQGLQALLSSCRWESIAANMFDCQVYAVSVRIRRLDLIGEISMAPRMEPNFIALPVYQISNHPDT